MLATKYNVFDNNLIDGSWYCHWNWYRYSITPRSNLYLRYKNVDYIDKNHENYFYDGYELGAEFKVIF